MSEPAALSGLVFVFVVCFGFANSAVFIPILQQDQDINPQDGSYKYSYATANGIMAVEEGKLQRPGTPDEAQAVEGVYTYLNSDGTLVNVRYVADEGGFRAVPNVVHRPAAITRGASAGGELFFHNYDSLRQALRYR